MPTVDIGIALAAQLTLPEMVQHFLVVAAYSRTHSKSSI
jgi:hypothetical protein